MPEKEGLETIVELKNETPNLTVIAYSGGARTRHYDYLLKAKELGADAVLSKPFADTDLIKLVEQFLNAA